MPLVIHIGSRKTGSKAIQQFLTANYAHGRGGFYLPSVGRSNSWYQPVYNALLEGNDHLLKKLQEELAEQPDRLSIISYEGFSKLPEELVEKLSSFLPGARIIYFIRPQYSFINSLLNQIIKAHRTRYSDIDKLSHNLLDCEPDMDIERTYRKWADCFGDKNMQCVAYSRKRNSIKAFIEATGKNYFLETINNQTQTNTALSEEGVIAFHNTKRLIEEDDARFQAITKLHQVGKNTGLFVNQDEEELFIISRHTVDAIIDYYKESNSRFFEIIGLTENIGQFFQVDDLNFSSKVTFPENPPAPPDTASIASLLGKLQHRT